ncbi:cAMP-binding domain of CRP or a regulatory subunit of cAMP-dependent protein kinases [Tranquillimonas rosea]|uniref:cAMP-binding domain of CRP or a regulatory subunit of cAMP-dependent protein kinases n=1 Tax=Tranquillimonas rosea TaxID=641238 RepID=A0A1H9WR42_9RHOB|nr:Crp/Fnr family transcriptional regulator [Tranquillimonas rosea]SES36402.1 cAMP-binding domain of CRP or a regulatory subunit of cAMP-dependent protein kinases [Tranquillimonas rosea]
MEKDDRTCLVRRLRRFIELNEAETHYIASIEEGRQDVRAGTLIADGTSDAQNPLHVLNGGWAVSWVPVGDRRQITRIYLPGEIIGLGELGAEQSGNRITMQTDGSLCPFPRARIGQAIAELPRLASLFLALAGVDQLTLRDRLVALAAWSAEDRFLHFLLDLRARLAVASVGSGNRFRVPFTQDEIGMAIGTTSVTVNKLCRTLRDRDWIEIDRPYYRLLAREEMERQVGFVNRYETLDTSWFPAG